MLTDCDGPDTYSGVSLFFFRGPFPSAPRTEEEETSECHHFKIETWMILRLTLGIIIWFLIVPFWVSLGQQRRGFSLQSRWKIWLFCAGNWEVVYFRNWTIFGKLFREKLNHSNRTSRVRFPDRFTFIINQRINCLKKKSGKRLFDERYLLLEVDVSFSEASRPINQPFTNALATGVVIYRPPKHDECLPRSVRSYSKVRHTEKIKWD